MGLKKFEIEGRLVGQGAPCLLIAEVGQAHDGSLGTAHAYIDAVADVGVDIIKFQTHIASAESTPNEPWRVKFSFQDKTRYEYWKRMEFTEQQWAQLADHAKKRGLIFLSSPFSNEAVALLDRIKVSAWKIGAGEITNIPMIERMAMTGKPIILSSGMATLKEIDTALASIKKYNSPFAILQCTTSYPCPPEKIGLNILSQLREKYKCPVGLSDHSGVIYSGLAATVLAANLVEVHVVFSKKCFGPDVSSSLTIEDLRQLKEGIQFIEQIIANPVDKEAMTSELSELRCVFGKSLVATRDLPIGHCLSEADMTLKKPGTGIPPQELKNLIDRTLKRCVNKNNMFTEHDFEE